MAAQGKLHVEQVLIQVQLYLLKRFQFRPHQLHVGKVGESGSPEEPHPFTEVFSAPFQVTVFNGPLPGGDLLMETQEIQFFPVDGKDVAARTAGQAPGRFSLGTVWV
ncbi:hypothetical protein NCCP2145_22030 [Pseudarthrobacter sp. NCCP-2145]|nr:hypothetical protein NCCP2145_22030 [Pseudarthrobacter sp. NCCP-2145]